MKATQQSLLLRQPLEHETVRQGIPIKLVEKVNGKGELN